MLRIQAEALTYDDVSLVPAHSVVLPKDVSLATRLTRNLRLNLPIGPLRLDYGIPITHDKDNGSSGRFQFGVGYTREF